MKTIISRRSLLWKVLLPLCMLALVAIVAIPPVLVPIYHARTSANLQHIGMALICYQEHYGCFPPQYLVDEQGKPAHSWRVLLLPYLGYKDLYRRYRFDEPWNGPHNKLLATEMPEEYRAPWADSKSMIAQYVGIAGKNTIWQGKTPLEGKEIKGDVANPLILFVEAANSDIHWMEPRDIPLAQALEGVNAPEGRGIQSYYSDGLPAQVWFISTFRVPLDTSTDAFRAMLTIPENQNGPVDVARP